MGKLFFIVDSLKLFKTKKEKFFFRDSTKKKRQKTNDEMSEHVKRKFF